jgi:hypothetical protein
MNKTTHIPKKLMRNIMEKFKLSIMMARNFLESMKMELESME